MGCNSSANTIDLENVSSSDQVIEYLNQKLEKCENILFCVQKLRKDLYKSIQIEKMSQHFLGNLYEDIHEVSKDISIKYPEESTEKALLTKSVKKIINQLKNLRMEFFDNLSDSKSLANSDKMLNNQDKVLELHWKQQTLYNYFFNNSNQHNTINKNNKVKNNNNNNNNNNSNNNNSNNMQRSSLSSISTSVSI